MVRINLDQGRDSAVDTDGQSRHRIPHLVGAGEASTLLEVMDAASAGLAVTITCQRCHRPHVEWACNLCLRAPAARNLPLNQIVGGFYCPGCGRVGTVHISVTRPGGQGS